MQLVINLRPLECPAGDFIAHYSDSVENWYFFWILCWIVLNWFHLDCLTSPSVPLIHPHLLLSSFVCCFGNFSYISTHAHAHRFIIVRGKVEAVSSTDSRHVYMKFTDGCSLGIYNIIFLVVSPKHYKNCRTIFFLILFFAFFFLFFLFFLSSFIFSIFLLIVCLLLPLIDRRGANVCDSEMAVQFALRHSDLLVVHACSCAAASVDQ